MDLELEDGLQKFSWEQKTGRSDGKRIAWNYYTIKAYLSGRLQKEKLDLTLVFDVFLAKFACS